MNSSLVIHTTRDNFQLYNIILVTNPQIHNRNSLPRPSHHYDIYNIKIMFPPPTFLCITLRKLRLPNDPPFLTFRCTFHIKLVQFISGYFFIFISPTPRNLLQKQSSRSVAKPDYDINQSDTQYTHDLTV
jgi:hypothetical protein